MSNTTFNTSRDEIAIIGMAGRFPGAKNVDEFWQNLCNGVEAIRSFTAEELQAAGVTANMRQDPAFVNAGAVMAEADGFDAAFFGYSAREAEIMDPQHRVFLECAWEALENAGYDPETFGGRIGVFGGVAPNTYFQQNLNSRPDLLQLVGHYPAMISSEREYAITRVAFKLNLRGPAISINTACSTSGVALHLAYQSVLSGECDMVLVGGARVKAPLTSGYLYQEDGILSPDGHCRAFDADARGTVVGNGVALLVIKRLAAALRDGDTVHAIIKGTAINNDGAAKIGYTAPSVQGQAAAIAEALLMADVHPESISYVEAHGTGTFLGDPIEVAALTQAFREQTQRTGYCALGSVKTNIGHLDAGAGAAGVIKTVLALKHKQLPPSLNFARPNPQIDFAHSPFYVNSTLAPWPNGNGPRRASVSSFGLGGTNAHIILEEAPEISADRPTRPYQLLLLSARSEAALNAATANLADYLPRHPEISLSDAAYTLQVGRRHFQHRRIVASANTQDAIEVLTIGEPRRVLTSGDANQVRTQNIVFMFPGGGAQYADMGRELYETEGTFRTIVDDCAALLQPQLGLDLRTLLYPPIREVNASAQEKLERPALALPILFTIEYALAKLWMEWGVTPAAMIGHSMGEYTAACLAGVFTLEEALALVTTRGQLFEKLPAGAMLSVRLSEVELRPRMSADLAFAAINLPGLAVVSGATASISRLEEALTAQGIDSTRLHIAVAAHSPLVEPILAEFAQFVQTIQLQPPQLPFVSNVTGDWITSAQATDPGYWVQHLRQTVRFADGLQTLLQDPNRLLLEVGPGQTLSTFARQHPARTANQPVISSMRHPKEQMSDALFLLNSLGRLWLAGVVIDWPAYYGTERRQRAPLPTYPFEHKRYWVEPAMASALANPHPVSANGANPQPISSTTGAIAMSEPKQILPAAPPRKERLIPEITQVLSDLSGLGATTLNPHATFLELGFDSLFLTQANTAFRKKFKVKLSFRQLFEEAPTVAALAAYLDGQLPADAFPAPVVAQPIAVQPAVNVASIPETQPAFPLAQLSPTLPSAPAITAAGANAIERIIDQQLQTLKQIMAQQLAALGSGAGMPSSPSTDGAPSPEGARADTAPSLTTASPSLQQSPIPPARAPVTSKNEQTTTATPAPVGPWKPIDTNKEKVLTAQQQQHLDNLTVRLTSRTPGSKRLTQANRAHLADPRTVAGFRLPWKEIVYPIVATRSAGSKIWDVDGNEFLDVAMGFGVNFFGHSPDFIMASVQEQLTRGVEIGPQSPITGTVAKIISELTGMERVAFCNTGSEAVLAALRMARTVTGNTKVVTFTGDYHGLFDEMLARGVTVNGQRRTIPIAPGIPAHAVQDVLVLDYADPASLAVIRAEADELAAVLVEPVQSRHPDLQPREFLLALRQLTAELGVPLIFDEMITGFRSHPGGVQALFGIQADLATYGKVVGGGFPIGVVAGKARFMDALDGGMWQYGDDSIPEAGVTWFAGTFVRHPVALSAALAALTRLQTEGPALQAKLNARTAAFVKEMNDYFQAVGAPLWLENFSSFFLLKFQSHQEYSSLFYFHLRDKGIHITEGRSAFLSTAHSDADIEHLLWAYKTSVAEMQAGGFLPGGGQDPSGLEIPDRTEAPLNIPLTEGQQEIWLATQVNRDVVCAYNLSNTLHLKGQLEVEKLCAAVQLVVDRHEALRTTIDPDGQSQRIAPRLTLEMPRVDLSLLAPAERDLKLAELRSAAVRTPFDLNNGPLLRALLIKLGAEEHLLFLTVHHIICDGWSSGILFHDLATFYTALCKGERPLLPAPMQLSEYARWHEEWKQSPEFIDAEKYWLSQFANSTPVLDLPTDRPRPPIKTYTATRTALTLEPSLVKALKQVAAKQGVTLFTLILAGFEAFLYRLTGQEDLVLGVSIAGQTQFAGRDLVSHCINLLPSHRLLNPAAKFSELLQATRLSVLDAFEYQNYTFGALVKKLPLPRDPSRIPLVSVLFNMDSAMQGLHFGSLEAQPGSNPRSFENFDWFINIVQPEQGLIVECTYNTDLFAAATIESRLQEYATLLASIVANPDCPIARLALLPEVERHLQLVAWNATQTDYPRHLGVHQLFEEQAARTPDAVALVFEEQQLTYCELNQRASQLAVYLQRQGVGPNTLVALCVERSVEMVVGLLGILKAGGAYIPLDPAFPAERLAYMLTDAQPPLLLTQQALVARLPVHGAEVICLDTAWPTIMAGALSASHQVLSDLPGQSALPGATPSEDLAYVIYTSGSTGKPKGVQIPHRALTNFLTAMQRTPGLTAQDTLLAVTTLSFDIAALELYLPLITGARLVIASRQVASDGAQLVAMLTATQPTMMQATPATWRLLLEAGWQGDPGLKILCGGEALPADLAKQLLARSGSLWNMYGPTETTVWSAVQQIQPGAPIVIGRPIANTQFYLLDAHQNPVPIGAVGELYIGGDGVAHGYLNRPEVTAERFIDLGFEAAADAAKGAKNPKSKIQNPKLYKTGDLARFHLDGTLEFLGRNDQQVKIRGFRIELGEIEAVLGRHPSVKEAVVVARQDDHEDKRLVAYIVLNEEDKVVLAAEQKTNDPISSTAAITNTLRTFVRQSLPDYMTPSAVVLLEALPLTPNGKVDRRALPAPEAQSETLHPFVAPRTPLEILLHKLWTQVLKIEQCSVHDDFYDLGGHSLLAARLLNRLQPLLGATVYMVALFDAPTIAQFADYLQRHYEEGVRRALSSTDVSAKITHANQQLGDAGRLDAAQIAQFHNLLQATRPNYLFPSEGKNPKAVFILCPPRSGSTLLRVMLAGNPALFSPPELHLLQFNRLDERKQNYAGWNQVELEGLVRAVMEIKGCNAQQAQQLIERYEEQGCSVQQFYNLLQGWVAPKLLVDKSPEYVLHLETLRRAEASFENAHYLHLTRHPLGMIHSFVDGKHDLASPYRSHFQGRTLGELIWLTSTQNVMDFLTEIPAKRQCTLMYENLVREPQTTLQTLCHFLGIPFHPAMLRPYQKQPGKMIDGIHPLSLAIGDPKFQQHTEIDATVADRWRRYYSEDCLSEITLRTANVLGYENLFTSPFFSGGGETESGDKRVEQGGAEREEFVL